MVGVQVRDESEHKTPDRQIVIPRVPNVEEEIHFQDAVFIVKRVVFLAGEGFPNTNRYLDKYASPIYALVYGHYCGKPSYYHSG